ncbi:MAG TPA: GNAT family N-acetyltransferase [Thermoanaerobaculia bacterium]|nr:GNAT family N-acetyltransferase [Thermoanaerobaculia bacterium]
MQLRRATLSDAEWINAAYARVHFLPSDPARDLVIVAELDGERAGIGRLVPAGERAYELGGMLVFENFRGRGVARSIIDELLRHAGDAEVYCIPFADLEPVYAKAGFTRRERHAALPAHIVEKLDWCAREMARPVILMQLTT